MKKYKMFALGLVCVVALIAVCSMAFEKKEDVTCRETTVEYGSLVVGIEESGTVDIGTIRGPSAVRTLGLAAWQE